MTQLCFRFLDVSLSTAGELLSSATAASCPSVIFPLSTYAGTQHCAYQGPVRFAKCLGLTRLSRLYTHGLIPCWKTYQVNMEDIQLRNMDQSLSHLCKNGLSAVGIRLCIYGCMYISNLFFNVRFLTTQSRSYNT